MFLRADLNVPIYNNKITNDFRLRAIIPTIDYIQKHNGKIILATHIGRPNLEKINEQLSTKHLLPWFEEHGYKIEHEKDLTTAKEKSKQKTDTVLLLENLRFFPGEQKQDSTLAKQLAKLADIYINDAWGVMHRNDTSVTLLAEEFKRDNKAFGLLIKKERKALEKLLNPKRPFLIILGGNKVTSKLNTLEKLVSFTQKNPPDTVLIGGAIATAFLSANGLEIGKSKLEEQNYKLAQHILAVASYTKINIILPRDVIVSTDQESQVGIYNDEAIPPHGTIIDIGPKTIELFSCEIAKAKTIYAGGTMGIYEQAGASTGTQKILEAIAVNKNAYTFVGGGDAVAAVHKYELENDIDFLSTGGGATLEELTKHEVI